MPNDLSHEAIAKRFLESSAVDFDAIGKFVAEMNGRDLVVSDQGLHGAIFGRYNILACMLPASDVVRLVGDLRGASLTAAALETRG